MCGRYANRSSDKELQSFLETKHTVGAEIPPSDKGAPPPPVRVIIERTPARNPTPSPSASSGRSNGACCRLVSGSKDGVQAHQRPQ